MQLCRVKHVFIDAPNILSLTCICALLIHMRICPGPSCLIVKKAACITLKSLVGTSTGPPGTDPDGPPTRPCEIHSDSTIRIPNMKYRSTACILYVPCLTSLGTM